MKLFSFRIRASSIFIFDAGTSTRRCFDPQAFRVRVSISAIGSVMLILPMSSSGRISAAGDAPKVWGMVPGAAGGRRPPLRSAVAGRRVLPARLAHAGDHPLERELAEADAADAELAQVGARAAAALAAVL